MLETHALAHQFETAAQQKEASRLGMWIFLATEVLLFGALFTGYAVYRMMYPDVFAQASHHLSLPLGTINTAVLICSSLTMAMAVHSAHAGSRRLTSAFLLFTLLLGGVFIGVKYFEYSRKFEEHLVPGPGFAFAGGDAAKA